jgi:hypothetical protein
MPSHSHTSTSFPCARLCVRFSPRNKSSLHCMFTLHLCADQRCHSPACTTTSHPHARTTTPIHLHAPPPPIHMHAPPHPSTCIHHHLPSTCTHHHTHPPACTTTPIHLHAPPHPSTCRISAAMKKSKKRYFVLDGSTMRCDRSSYWFFSGHPLGVVTVWGLALRVNR